MAQRGMKFGIFLAPFHSLGENPTLAMARDMELIEWLDWLGYDEAWIGEHHSAGWEVIASPEIFIAQAADRTRHIMLGSGVTSLPYHHPFLVAQRFVQLDHMTRGRVMLGCGPGALPSDAYMMGIEPVHLRRRMEESLDAIIRLLRCDEPVTMATDWFELREARLHLAPYSDPRFHIAVASTITPFGMVAAGRHGLGVLSIGAGLPGGPEAMASQWRIAEDTAAQHGTAMNRKDWRIVVGMHIAADDEEALRQVKAGERHESLVAASDGGFGGIMFRAHEWANREETMKSYELFARHVMPHFQGSAATLAGSNQWIRDNRRRILGNNVEAVRRAFTDTGRAVPDEYRYRTVGAQDIDPVADG
jgi:limonene 1,2-monooxygenase